jgi:D-threo-aldose 1-dehydrogenase
MTGRRRIGSANVEVAPLGFGGAAIGTLYADVTDAECHSALQRFFELDLNLIDTAPYYGFGKSEERIGAYIASRTRESFVLSTKVGRVLIPERPDRVDRSQFVNPGHYRPVKDFSYRGVMDSFFSSLERLRTDSVEIVHIHDPDDDWEQAMNEAYPALHDLKQAGRIRAISVGMNQWQMLARFATAAHFDCFLLAGRYTLLDHSALPELLPLCLSKRISVIIGGPFNSGILAGGAHFEYSSAPPEILDRLKRLDTICERHNVNRKAAALQFPLAHPAVAAVIPGIRSAAELEENHSLLGEPIPPEFWDDLRETEVIPADAPAPPHGLSSPQPVWPQ